MSSPFPARRAVLPRLTAWIASVALMGCSAALTGAWVLPRGASSSAVARGDLPTAFVSATVVLPGHLKPMPDVCQDDVQGADCQRWADTMGASLANAMTAVLQRKDSAFRYEAIDGTRSDWRQRARPGDVHVAVRFNDLLDRQFNYGVLVMWRSDTYDARATVSVTDVDSDKLLATFHLSDQQELGLNYMWFIDIFIPLFPLYLDDNETGRAGLVGRLMKQLGERLTPVLAAAHNAPRPQAGESATAGVASAPAGPGPSGDRAGDSLSVERWLGLPNVRLLAVEFFADWCEPCKQAAPRWQALHEKYRDQGLRVVVVHTQSRGLQASPGWSPDHVVADPYGVLAKAWKADQLPQAFLWSWDGRALVAHGSVEGVEREVRRWFAHAPRIAVAQASGADGQPLPVAQADALRATVRGELTRLGKFDVVADEAERALIATQRKAGHSLNRDAQGRCALGMELSPNMLLKIVRQTSGETHTLRLELFGIEKSCMIAWASVPLKRGEGQAAVAEAVSKLLIGLRSSTAAPPAG